MGAARDRTIDRALVRAALLPGEAAVAAWRSLPDDFELDEIWDPERARLLAPIGEQLTGAGVDDPDLPRLRGIAKKQWAEHQLMSRRLVPLIDAMVAAGVVPVLVGGGGIGRAEFGYAGALGQRWADGTCLLVAPDDAVGAVAAIEPLVGLLPSAARRARMIEWRQSMPFQFDDGTWSRLMFRPAPTLTDWRVGPAVDVAGRQVATLDALSSLRAVASQLVCAREQPGLSWLLDVDRLVRSGEIDLAAASLSPEVAELLGVYEAAVSGSDDSWIDACRRATTPVERLRLDVASFGPDRPVLRRVVGAGEFLADRWALDRQRDVPRAAAARVVSRLRRGR